jgi:hypothetical protein
MYRRSCSLISAFKGIYSFGFHFKSTVSSGEKGREAICESTCGYLSLVLLGRGWSSSYGILERAKRCGSGPPPQSASWAENNHTTEHCEGVGISSLSVLSGLWSQPSLLRVGGPPV